MDYTERVSQLTEEEKVSAYDYAELAMAGNADAKNAIESMFGPMSNMGDYFKLVTALHDGMTEATKDSVDHKVEVRCNTVNRPVPLNPKKVINHLALLRQKAGLTQRELEKRSGVFIRTIQKYESGEKSLENMSLHNAVAIAAALGVKAEDLLP